MKFNNIVANLRTMKRIVTLLLTLVMLGNMLASYTVPADLPAGMCVETDQKQTKDDKKELKEFIAAAPSTHIYYHQLIPLLFKEVRAHYLMPVLSNLTPPPDVLVE